MTAEEAFVAFNLALEKLSVPHMIVGAFSVNLYAVPRSTQDADYLVEFNETRLEDLMQILPEPFELDPQAQFDITAETTRHEIHVDSIPYRFELFDLSGDAHDRERFKRKLRVKMEGFSVWAPTPEDVVITKLRWYKAASRSKDLEDARNLVVIQGSDLQSTYIQSWCEQHGTMELYRSLAKS
ncbi:MAG: DUF6036 family nucleotidyltransferase [Verrucomicrobiota bacterium]